MGSFRSILGSFDTPESAYVLVVRGVNSDTRTLLDNHRAKFPNWGMLVFPEKDESDSPFISPVMKGIHRIYTGKKFSASSDKELIEFVLEEFPPYMEDYPVLESKEFDSVYPETPAFDISGHYEHLVVTSRISDEERLRHPDILDAGILSSKRSVLNALLSNPRFWKVTTKDFYDSKEIKVELRVMYSDL